VQRNADGLQECTSSCRCCWLGAGSHASHASEASLGGAGWRVELHAGVLAGNTTQHRQRERHLQRLRGTATQIFACREPESQLAAWPCTSKGCARAGVGMAAAGSRAGRTASRSGIQAVVCSTMRAHQRPDDEDDADGAEGQRGGGAVGDGHSVEEGEGEQQRPAEQRSREQHVAHPGAAAKHLVLRPRHVARHACRVGGSCHESRTH